MKPTKLRDITSWVSSVEQLVDEGTCACPSFFRPFHFLILAMELKRSGGNVSLPEKIMRYAVRMRLWEAIDQAPPFNINAYNPAGKFHPVEPLIDQNAVDDTSECLVEIFRRAGIDDGAIDGARTVVQELLGNCFAHAESDNGLHGLACAQYWPGGDLAQIAICDSGIGIRTSLSANDDLLLELVKRNACEMATEYSVTSKPGKGHSGYGLTLARDLIEQAGGTIYVVSQDEFFYSSGGVTDYGGIPTTLNGTLIVLEWDTKVPLNLRQVYNAWPLPEGMDDDDYDL
ncbi:ATP-binding protein [Burkholderia ubonensis]|uniref:ATP-binding protein n=1 Tax=Burkholderia TaxID=32008 RepID=UPI0009B2F883|nr:ATP-binding protein [Burkholderia ubonensis]